LNRQVAKESIADPVPRRVPEATNGLGVLAPWRFAVVALSALRLPDVPYAITLGAGVVSLGARVAARGLRFAVGA
jgi:hypothetical protein